MLDESHAIKDSTNKQSQACQVLESSRRWCVSGTPMSSTTEDLVGQLKFLGFDSGLDQVRSSVHSIEHHNVFNNFKSNFDLFICY